MTESDSAKALRGRIEGRTAKVGIVGLGYVGLPLALAFAERGFPVLGFDVDPAKVEALGRGECYIRHLDAERVRAQTGTGRLEATADFERLPEADAILICVPTPLTRQREPELRYVRTTAEQIGRRLRPGQLVVLESTT
ncbi:MAG TPA: NAD(P)-binding domain-containing protein, partial [Thermoanaerobaculia bacterium]|nr:NAD(P)-binding domain-containing protein [Thermoanaerobaculia bacterium]